MLVGLAIMLAVIVFHLFVADQLMTDFIAIIGLLFVFVGASSKE